MTVDNEMEQFHCAVAMSDQILSTIEVLAAKVAAKEEEANKLKKIINELCAEAGISARYDSIAEDAGAGAPIRRDQFYGQTITGAARTYLELRKSRGAMPFPEIFKGIKDGGYKFSTNNEENQKTALRDALRKNSSIFHRLPTGDYGLLSWYPGAKAAKKEDSEPDAETRKPAKEKKPETGGASENYLTNDEIREAVFAQEGNFSSVDIEKKLSEMFPGKQQREGAISMALFHLKKSGFLRVVVERKGKIGAQYVKA